MNAKDPKIAACVQIVGAAVKQAHGAYGPVACLSALAAVLGGYSSQVKLKRKHALRLVIDCMKNGRRIVAHSNKPTSAQEVRSEDDKS